MNLTAQLHRIVATKKKIISALLAAVLIASGGLYSMWPAPHEHAAHESSLAHAGEKNSAKTLYTCSMHPWILQDEPGDCPICGMKLVAKTDGAAQDKKASNTPKERKILYWKAPMDPTEIYDKPGKSKMGMDLVPVYEDQVSGGAEITIDPVTQQNMGVRTTKVLTGDLGRVIRTYGHLTYDETRTAQITPKFNGWIEKLHVAFTGQSVKKNQPLFDIYSPSLVTAQEEYLAAFRAARQTGDTGLLAAARKRLANMDVPEEEILLLEKNGQAKRALTIRSPFAGVVIDKKGVLGGFIKQGSIVFTIADLSRIWAEGHIYEYELPLVKVGQKAVMTLSYLPGESFEGKVSFVYPYLQQKTRDILVRLEFDNPHMKLKPEMYGNVRIFGHAGATGMVIPSEAVIRSGERTIVFVSRGDGKFTPRKVTLGAPLDQGMIHVLAGLTPDETVVTSGQFLLDSESRLKEAIRKMMEVKHQGSGDSKQQTGDGKKQDNDFFGDMDKTGGTDQSRITSDDFFKDM